MKKMLRYATIYFGLAMIGGVFYREFTKFYHYTGTTTLSVIHTHLLTLGMFLFLFLMLACKMSNLEKIKKFKTFLITYNIALPFMSIMLFIRGIVQVTQIDISNGLNAAIAGISGVAHVLILVSFIYLFLALHQEFSKD